MGTIVYGSLKTGIVFTNSTASILATIVLPAGKWIVAARCAADGSSASNGTTVDITITTSQMDSCSLTIPGDYKWDRKNLIGMESDGGKTLNVLATPYGPATQDQIKCQNLYAIRIK